MEKVSCIVASYNEEKRVIKVLEALQKVPSIYQIVFVDDGSVDNSYNKVQKMFPNITAFRLIKNQGKTEAVKKGLQEVKEKTVLLVDADLEGLRAEEIEEGIQKFFASSIDMLIFQIKTTYARIDGMLNKYIVFSGTRIIKTDLLLMALEQKRKPIGYQLEAAINQFCIDEKKQVRWIACSAVNPNKLKKEGFIYGFLKNIKMEIQIAQYTGLITHWKQILFFGRTRIAN